jgi:hypothetical protein
MWHFREVRERALASGPSRIVSMLSTRQSFAAGDEEPSSLTCDAPHGSSLIAMPITNLDVAEEALSLVPAGPLTCDDKREDRK